MRSEFKSKARGITPQKKIVAKELEEYLKATVTPSGIREILEKRRKS